MHIHKPSLLTPIYAITRSLIQGRRTDDLCPFRKRNRPSPAAAGWGIFRPERRAEHRRSTKSKDLLVPDCFAIARDDTPFFYCCESDAKSHAKPGGARDSRVGEPRRVKWGS